MIINLLLIYLAFCALVALIGTIDIFLVLKHRKFKFTSVSNLLAYSATFVSYFILSVPIFIAMLFYHEDFRAAVVEGLIAKDKRGIL